MFILCVFLSYTNKISILLFTELVNCILVSFQLIQSFLAESHIQSSHSFFFTSFITFCLFYVVFCQISNVLLAESYKQTILFTLFSLVCFYDVFSEFIQVRLAQFHIKQNIHCFVYFFTKCCLFYVAFNQICISLLAESPTQNDHFCLDCLFLFVCFYLVFFQFIEVRLT